MHHSVLHSDDDFNPRRLPTHPHRSVILTYLHNYIYIFYRPTSQEDQSIKQEMVGGNGISDGSGCRRMGRVGGADG